MWQCKVDKRQVDSRLATNSFRVIRVVAGFLRAFARLRKLTINFVMSVCLPVCLSACLSAQIYLENSNFIKIRQE